VTWSGRWMERNGGKYLYSSSSWSYGSTLSQNTVDMAIAVLAVFLPNSEALGSWTSWLDSGYPSIWWLSRLYDNTVPQHSRFGSERASRRSNAIRQLGPKSPYAEEYPAPIAPLSLGRSRWWSEIWRSTISATRRTNGWSIWRKNMAGLAKVWARHELSWEIEIWPWDKRHQ